MRASEVDVSCFTPDCFNISSRFSVQCRTYILFALICFYEHSVLSAFGRDETNILLCRPRVTDAEHDAIASASAKVEV